LCLLTDNNDNPIIIQPHIVFTDGRQQRQPNRLSVSTICGHIMIGLSLLSFVSKHNMLSYYDWVVVVVCLLTDDNKDYPIILQPHIVFTDGKQRQPNHNCCPSINTICGRIMIGLSLLLSVSYHNKSSCYDWVVVVVVCQ
jgi:hypothetical protein